MIIFTLTELIACDRPNDTTQRGSADGDAQCYCSVPGKVLWADSGRWKCNEGHANAEQQALSQEELVVLLTEGDHEDGDELDDRACH